MLPSNTCTGEIVPEKSSTLHMMPLSSPSFSESPSCPCSPDPHKEVSMKKVRFSDECRLRVYSSGMTSPESRKQKLWYNDVEYQSMLDECESTIRLAKKALRFRLNGKSQKEALALVCQGRDIASMFPFRRQPEEQYSSRGLEHHICPEIRHLRRYRRVQALEAVYYEQMYQYDTDSYSPERIAKVCRIVSEASQREAHARAWQRWKEQQEDDASPAMAINNEDDDNSYGEYHEEEELQREQDSIMAL